MKEDIRVLFIHCYYNKWGGEDVTFEAEKKLFPNSLEYTVKNKTGIRGILQFVSSIWNIRRARDIKHLIERENPDIIHVYNFHFGLGPFFIRYLKKRFNIPIIATIQNFRLLCPSATFLINEELSTKSLKEKFPWSAIRKGAYRNSIFLTFYLSAANWIHSKIKTWHKLDAVLLQTEFAKNLFLSSRLGLSKNQIQVKSNGIEAGYYFARERNQRFLFVGRISVEKGIHSLLHIFSQLPFELDVVGEGPLLESLQKKYSKNSNINFLGKRNSEDVKTLMQSASCLVFPSIWFEGMPLTILEAFACGTPVLSSAIGAMNYLIEPEVNGLLIETGNEEEWIKTINRWYDMPVSKKQHFSENARMIFLDKYSSECNEKKLLEIYSGFLNNEVHVHLIKKPAQVV